MTLPYVPPDIEISKPQNNEEFQTINNGILNLIGDEGLKSLSIQSFFPTKKYHWMPNGANENGWEYVEFFDRWREAKVPIRIVMQEGERVVLNMACLVDSFTYYVKRNKDIGYTLAIKEYRFV